jgi:cytoskeletal protein RodZ
MVAALVVLALVGSVAVIGVPAGWYTRTKASVTTSEPVASAETVAQPVSQTASEVSNPETPDASAQVDDAAVFAARRQRERDRAKARGEKAAMLTEANASSPAGTNVPVAPNTGPRKISVTVTYDESGRVVQASGGDPSALRIARQKRFPPGKGGSATVTIPIN